MNCLETKKTMSDRQFQHAMLREIYEQPDALARTMEQYVADGHIEMKALTDAAECFRKHKDLIIAASGSSRHAGLGAKIMLEDAAGLSVDVEYASEYITRSSNTKRDPAVVVISQSGETADTLMALREAIQRGHPTLAVTNVAASTMAREATVSLPTCAGVEKAIPATKSFTTQLVVLRLLSLLAAEARKQISTQELTQQIALLQALPAAIERQLDGWQDVTRALAGVYYD